MRQKTIFISYSRHDSAWLRRLRDHLDPLLAGTTIKPWDDSQLEAGEEWESVIQNAIYNSCAAVLLVSPNFLATKFVTTLELPLFLAAAKERGMLILWMLVADCSWQSNWFSAYQALHSPMQPITSLDGSRCEEALFEIAKGIFSAVSSQPPLPFEPRPLRRSQTPIPPRLFPKLPPAFFKEADLLSLADGMDDAYKTPVPSQNDRKPKAGIPLGYLYLGQFIDRDMTFPQFGADQGDNQPPFFGKYEAPFDLHSIYGYGPKVQPYLFHRDRLHMQLGASVSGNPHDPDAREVPRTADGASALIGDSRNDQDIIISQLHAMMLRFHNRVADLMGGKSLLEIQRTVRFHFQWLVIYDFLSTMIGAETLHGLLPPSGPHLLKLYEPALGGIPIEFSLAVFRFGHSMVRPSLDLNSTVGQVPVVSTNRRADSTTGNRPCPLGWAVDWSLFFNMCAAACETTRVQYARNIGPSIWNPFGSVVDCPAPLGLSFRNLMRGLRSGLPSGQAVSEAMGVAPVPNDQLMVGGATDRASSSNKLLKAFSKQFRNNAPLWYYILAEAQQQFVNNECAVRLGPVGGRIVGEVLIGLMLSNPDSYLSQEPEFRPHAMLCSPDGHFGMKDLLREAMKAAPF
jgi:hypothetical protein